MASAMHAWIPRLVRTAPLLAVLGAAGCVVNSIELEEEATGPDADDDEADPTDPPPATTTAATTVATTIDPDTGPRLDLGGDTDGGLGFCSQTCQTANDCGSGTDFACTDGFCEYVGEFPPCEPATCDDLGIGAACSFVNGYSVCTFPCTPGGGECDFAMLECSGLDDLGNPICMATPCGGAGEGEPCAIEGFGTYGTCIDGECRCSSDLECTGQGLGCDL